MDRRLQLLTEISPAIWIHLIAAIAALALGALVLWRRKGDRPHKFAGRIWVALMLVTALSSFFITEIRDGAFSPIHLLSLYSLGSLAYGVGVFYVKDRASAIRGHQIAMKNLYVMALLVAGAFTFLPDRILGRLISETSVIPHTILVTLCLCVAVFGIIRARHVTMPPA
jgi:uncharacterized membrane protein